MNLFVIIEGQRLSMIKKKSKEFMSVNPILLKILKKIFRITERETGTPMR